MTHSWRSQSETKQLYESSSDISPLTPFRPKLRPTLDIPPGSVASRILELQSLAANSSGSIKPFSIKAARLDHSRAGYGRRKSARFGKPASRSSRPDGSDTTHSFLALRSCRASHMEEHAHIDSLAKRERSSSVKRKLQPLGMGIGSNCEATGPSETLLKTKSSKNMQESYKKQPREAVSVKKPVNLLNAAVAPSSPVGYYLDRISPVRGRNLRQTFFPDERPASDQQNKRSTKGSEESTISVRKQSVKDLYSQYGIEIPAGLLSEADDTPRNIMRDNTCHVCSSSRGPACRTSPCQRCGHHFCDLCFDLMDAEASRIQPQTSTYNSRNRGRKLVMGSQLQREHKAAPTRPTTSKNPFQRPIPLPERITYEDPVAELPNLTQSSTRNIHSFCSDHNLRSKTKLAAAPSFDNTTLRDRSQRTALNSIEMPSPRPTQSISATKFPPEEHKPIGLVTSLNISSSPPFGRLPVAVPITVHSMHQKHDKSKPGGYSYSMSSTESDQPSESDKYCDSSGCRATHSGYRPYRHSISCTRRRLSSLGHAGNDCSRRGGTSHSKEHKSRNWNCKKRARFQQKERHEARRKCQDSSSFVRTSVPTYKKIAGTPYRDHKPKRAGHHQYPPSPHPEQTTSSCSTSTSNGGQSRQQSSVTIVVQPPTRHETLALRESKSRKGTIISPMPLSHLGSRRTSERTPKRESIPKTSNWTNSGVAIAVAEPPSAETASPHAFEESCMDDVYFKDSRPVEINQFQQPTAAEHDTPGPRARRLSQVTPTVVLSTQASVKPPSARSSVLSRRVSSFFRIQSKNSVPLVSKRLQGHQERLWSIEHAQSTPSASTKDDKKRRATPELEQRMKQWKLKFSAGSIPRERANGPLVTQYDLEGNEGVSPYSKNAPPQRIEDYIGETSMDEELYNEGIQNGKKSKKVKDHDCPWKQLLLENSNRTIIGSSVTLSPDKNTIGILGVSVIIHLEGREELVLKAPLGRGAKKNG